MYRLQRPLFRRLGPSTQPWRMLNVTTPRSELMLRPAFDVRRSRYATLEAGDGKTGHLQVGPENAIVYFDHVYPLRLSWLFHLPWQPERTLPELMDRMKNSRVSRLNPLNIIKDAKPPAEVNEVVPRLKEGGAFVKFSLPANSSAEDVETSLRKYLKDARIKPWWNPFQRMRVHLVRGKPWVEDLYRLPSSRLKVEFLPTSPGGEAAELSQEQLYEHFRHYGKLADIIPQPPDSKILPKFAYVDFMGIRRGIMARNCLHGYIVSQAQGGGAASTVLRVGYERKIKSNWLKDWLVNHPRIVIPIIAALLAGITVVVFDPIRTFFIKAHIKHSFDFSDNRIYRWFKSQASDIFSFRRKKRDEAGMSIIWDDRKANINQLQTWLMETTDTFIIVQGPRGSGKKELVVEQGLKNRKNKLIIDCKPIQEARGDAATICAAAAQVGYRPVFSWTNTISGWVDLAAQGTTGMKTGFSETLDTQLAKILNNTATALKQIALEGRHKNDKDSFLTEDEYLDAHPERRPVIVVDNFLHKSQDSTIVYDKIAEWAAGLTTANVAHIIFLTHDVSFSKSLSKALPDRVFRQMSLGDCSPEAAKRFVISHLDADGDEVADPDNPERKLTPSQRRKDLVELDDCITSVGGRLTDLEFLARRIKMGQSPHQAVHEIIQQSASEILKMYVLNSDQSNTGQHRWTAEQVWSLIKQLAASPSASLRYNEIVLDDTFKVSVTHGADAVLQALEQAELISIVVSPNGRPHTIKPGKPVYHAAFQRLTEDRVLKSRLDLQTLTELIKIENSTVEKCESELKLLGDLPRQPYEITPRVKWLLGKIASSHAKVEGYEKESSALKSVLQSEF